MASELQPKVAARTTSPCMPVAVKQLSILHLLIDQPLGAFTSEDAVRAPGKYQGLAGSRLTEMRQKERQEKKRRKTDKALP